MPLKPSALAPAVASLLLAALLAGCGSQTKTVTVNGPPALTTGDTSQRTTPTQSTPAPATSTPAATSTAPATTTRTATEPAFTQKEPEAESASAAAAVVRARGYTAENTSEYHPGQTLRVLVGTRTGSSDGYNQQAFFFLDGRYIGTDTKEPSAQVKVVSQSDTEVALAYTLYRSKDPLCCATGGHAVVHFVLNNGKLTPLERIPPANSNTAASRN